MIKILNINDIIVDYDYLGGSYGRCIEEFLLIKLIEKYTVAVSFVQDDYNFMMNWKGIYNWMRKHL